MRINNAKRGTYRGRKKKTKKKQDKITHVLVTQMLTARRSYTVTIPSSNHWLHLFSVIYGMMHSKPTDKRRVHSTVLHTHMPKLT